MANLRESGLDEVIREVVKKEIPFLGICLGLQLLFESSEEAPGVAGLGILKGKILRIPERAGLKIPHMGWNSLHLEHDEDSSGESRKMPMSILCIPIICRQKRKKS